MEIKKTDNCNTINVLCRHCKKEMRLSVDNVEHFLDNTLYWVECPHCRRASEISEELKGSQEGRNFLESVHKHRYNTLNFAQ